MWLIALLAAALPAWAGSESDPNPAPAVANRGQTPAAPLTGQVVDARTGAPLEKVLVVVEDAGKSVLTDAEGRFRIAGLIELAQPMGRDQP